MNSREHYDPIRFGKRLKDELDRSQLHVRELQRQLAERTNGARGTSLGNLSSWLNGLGPDGIEPRPNIVRALAEIFGVRPDYLLYGGPRTDLEAEREGFDIVGRLAAVIPAFRDFTHSAQLLFILHLQRWGFTRKREGMGEPSIEDMIDYGRTLWRWILHPLAVMEHTSVSGSEKLNDYVIAAIHARDLALDLPKSTPTPRKA